MMKTTGANGAAVLTFMPHEIHNTVRDGCQRGEAFAVEHNRCKASTYKQQAAQSDGRVHSNARPLNTIEAVMDMCAFPLENQSMKKGVCSEGSGTGLGFIGA